MSALIRISSMLALAALSLGAVRASADYDGASGYGGVTVVTQELDVSHDGYPSAEAAATDPTPVTTEASDPPNYVVIEVEEGSSNEVDGETVIVVQEPEPTAATEHAPPAPRTVIEVEQRPVCSNGIWVDGYWAYANGQYVWVNGHCVVERVNYVFVHPRWDFYANVWWFVPGYYRPCGVWVGFGYYRPWHWFPPHPYPYYRHHRGVPVHRGVARRPTSAHPARPARGVSRTRTPSVARTAPGRTPTVGRTAPARTPTVVGSTPTRTSSVARRAPTRAPSVVRTTPTRAPTVVRTSPTRAPSVVRSTPARGPSIVRSTPTRSPMVDRSAPTRAPSIVRSTPMRTSGVGRPSSSPSARSPSARRSGLGSGRFGGFSRPSSSPARTSPIRRPSTSPFRGSTGGGSFGRPSMSPSRGSFGRPGGFSRPTSGGFGGVRSVPTTRGR